MIRSGIEAKRMASVIWDRSTAGTSGRRIRRPTGCPADAATPGWHCHDRSDFARETMRAPFHRCHTPNWTGMIRSAISQWMQGATRHFPLGPAAAENWNATFPGMETMWCKS